MGAGGRLGAAIAILALAACGGADGTRAAAEDAGDTGDAGGAGGAGAFAECPLFLPDNAWNADVSGAPVDPMSDAWIASIGADAPLHPDFGSDPEVGIPYVDVGPDVPGVKVVFDYADESDPGPYPIPPDPPIEAGGDRHVLVVQHDACVLYELWAAELDADGWHAGSGAVWNLRTNATRPAGWTSADAAGLPIFPGLVRRRELVEKGAIAHALRFTAPATRRAYVAPATHFASQDTDPALPPMGLRVRLKASVDVSGFAPEVRAVLAALKTYGMLLADNGSPWFVSGAPDPAWDDDALHAMTRLHGRDFEAVQAGPLVTR